MSGWDWVFAAGLVVSMTATVLFYGWYDRRERKRERERRAAERFMSDPKVYTWIFHAGDPNYLGLTSEAGAQAYCIEDGTYWYCDGKRWERKP